MTLEIDYIPFATGGSADVMDQATYASDAPDGVVPGLADPTYANKAWRQSSMIAAAVANFIANTLNVNVIDDGNLSALTTNLTDAIEATTSIGGAKLAHGECRLALSGSNLVLSPYNGNNLIIAGTQYQIPSGGVSLAPTSLSIGTFYYIYAHIVSGSIALAASTTTHATDTTTGVEIMSGNSSYTLVGAAYVVSGPAFADTNGERYVLSWFNRKLKISTTSFSTNRSTTSTSFVEINSEIRSAFITWVDEAVLSAVTGEVSSNTSSGQVNSAIAFDGATPSAFQTFYESNTTNAGGNAAVTASALFSEAAQHYQTIIGAVNTGTGTWNATSSPMPGSANCVLTVMVKG